MDNQVPITEKIEEERCIDGWLLKKMEHTGAWKKRWFVIRGSNLTTYEDENLKKAKLKGLSLVGASVGEVRHSTRDFVFVVQAGKKTMHLAAESEQALDDWLDYIESLPDVKVFDTPQYVPRSTFGKLLQGGAGSFPKDVTFAVGDWNSTLQELGQYYTFPSDIICSGPCMRNWESGVGTIGDITYTFMRLNIWICYPNPKMKNGQEYTIKYVQFVQKKGQRIESTDTDPNLPGKYDVSIPTVNQWLVRHGLPELT